MSCERCGHPDAAYSHRLVERVCSNCYHDSFGAVAQAEAERVDLQRGIARAIRAALPEASEACRQRLADFPLFLETARSAAEVFELLDEVEGFGLAVELL
jgi:hypothetical protein